MTRFSSVPFGGGGTVELASGQGFVSSIVVDDGFVYWDADSHTGRAIYKVGVDGGTATKVAETRPNSSADIAVDETHVYWAEVGQIHRVPK